MFVGVAGVMGEQKGNLETVNTIGADTRATIESKSTRVLLK